MSSNRRGAAGPRPGPGAGTAVPRQPRSLLVSAAVLTLVALLVVLVSCGQGSLLGAPPTGGQTTATSRATAATPRATTTRASRPATTRPSPVRPSATVTGRDPESGLPLVALGALPVQAQETAGLIGDGGPFPYSRDGVVFGNRERLLPAHPSGWYHEYTVRTPGSADRGARRLITGDGTRQLFYTGDHYASFVRVVR